jgi:putative endonuclease
MDSDNYFVYGISSEVANKFYVGMSADPQIRLKQHNAGHSQFTKGFCPWKLVYSEFVGTREEARIREKYFKTGAGRKYWTKKIKEMNRDSEPKIFK